MRRGGGVRAKPWRRIHVIVLFPISLIIATVSVGLSSQMKLINEKLAQIFGHFIAHVLMDSLIQRAERIAPPSS